KFVVIVPGYGEYLFGSDVIVPGHGSVFVQTCHSNIDRGRIPATTVPLGWRDGDQVFFYAEPVLLVVDPAYPDQPRRKFHGDGRSARHPVVYEIDVHIEKIGMSVQLYQIGIKRMVLSLYDPSALR